MSIVDRVRDEAPAFPSHVDPATIRVRLAPDESQRRPGASAHKANGLLAIAILMVAALAPIPLGSNRPAFWMMWSTLIGALAFTYGAALLWRAAPPRFGFAQLWPEATAFVLLCLFVAVQTLPIGGWLPPGLTALDMVGRSLTAMSFDIGSTRLALIQFATFGVLVFLSAQVAVNRRRARQMLLALFLIIAVFAVVGLASLTQFGDTLLGFEKTAYLGYATGTFVNRNSFAGFLGAGLTIGMPLLIELVVKRKERQISTFLWLVALIVLSLILIAAALIATGSRLGTLSGVLGAAVALALSLFAYRGSARMGASMLVIVLIAGVVVLAVFGMPLVERLVLTPGVDESRAAAHQLVWQAILARPWTGYGAGSFPAVFTMLQAPPLSGEYIWEYTHSTYLALWFELGLVAGSLPLLIVALLGWRTLRAMGDSSSTVNSVAALGVIVVFGVHSLLDFPLEIEANAFLFCIILALGAAGHIGARKAANG